MKFKFSPLILVCMATVAMHPLAAQQKGQWVPGQYGLNAGVIPSPGFTYQNLALNYSASSLNDASGNGLPGITGTYSFWVDENIFMFVYKFLGGYFAPYASVNAANGSLVADSATACAETADAGLADTLEQPFNMGWHFSRLDLNAGYAFTAPTGRFTPGANNNVGSGYWGNNLTPVQPFTSPRTNAPKA
jgi:hypothetical protein